jgi:hypothetical protein
MEQQNMERREEGNQVAARRAAQRTRILEGHLGLLGSPAAHLRRNEAEALQLVAAHNCGGTKDNKPEVEVEGLDTL